MRQSQHSNYSDLYKSEQQLSTTTQSFSDYNYLNQGKDAILIQYWFESTKSLLEKKEDDDQKYKQDAWRWVNLACLFGPLVTMSALMMIFTPISPLLRDAYQTDDFVISSNSTIFLIMAALVNLPCVYLLESGSSQGEGMYVWFRRSCMTTIVGQWGRFFVLILFPNQFWLTIFPAAVTAFGMAFFQNGISKFACVWFGDHQRTIAIGILSLGLAIGSTFGFFLGTCFVHDVDKNDPQRIKQETTDFMWFVSLMTTVLCSPLIFFYRQKPENFPSKSAQESSNLVKQRNVDSVMNELPALFSNGNFRLIFTIFVLMNGSVTSSTAFFSYLIEPYGFNTQDCAYFGVASTITGMSGAIIFPILMQKYQWYLKSLKIIVFGGVIAQTCLWLSLTSRNYTFSMISFYLFGLFNVPVVPVIYSFATEITYPVSEALFGCVLQAGSCIFSSIMTFIVTSMIKQGHSTSVLIMYIFFYVICNVCALFVKEDLRRLKIGQDNVQVKQIEAFE